MMDFIRKNKFYASVFLVAFTIALLTPITGDDYTFMAYMYSINGLDGFIGANIYMYENLNGRILGNGMQLALISLPVVSIIVRAAITTLLVWLAVRLVWSRNDTIKYIIATGVIFIPLTMFTQTYVWQAGFYNYVTSSVLVMAHVLIIKESYYTKKTPKTRYLLSIAAITLAGSLFAENVSVVLLIINVIGSLILFIIGQSQSGLFKVFIASLIGSVAGCLMMFGSPVYRTIAAGGDGYRSVATESGGFIEVIAESSHAITSGLIGYQSIIIILLLSLTVLTTIAKKKPNRFAIGIAVVSVIYPLWIVFSNVADINTHIINLSDKFQTMYYLISSLLSLIYIGSYLLFVKLYIKNSRIAKEVTLLTLVSLLFVAPFIVLSPFGPRNFLLSYLLLLIAVVISFNYFIKLKDTFIRNVVIIVGLLCYIMVSGFLLVNKICEQRNLQDIYMARNQEELDVLTLRIYPFSKMIHNPHDPHKVERYLNKMDCQYTDCTPGVSNTEVLFKKN